MFGETHVAGGKNVSSKNKKKKKGQGQGGAGDAPQRYIPGLNSADDPNVVIPLNKATKKQAAKQVPAELVEEFLDGKKNPISALTEYGALLKLIIAFEECPVARPSIVARFASRAKVNGKPFPQGTGANKKDAKTAAAKIALSTLLGLESEDVEDEADRGKLVLDAYGRKMVIAKDEIDDDTMSYATSVASSKLELIKDRSFKPQVELPSVEEVGMRPLWDQPKNPVSALTEYCSRNDFNLSWNVSDKPLDMGFKAEVYINDDIVAFAYALTKKDSKKEAALKALKTFAGGKNMEDVADPHGRATVRPSKPNPRPATEAEAIASAPQVGGAPLNMPTYRGVGGLAQEDRKNHIEMLQDYCKSHRIVLELEVSDYPAPNGLFDARVAVNNQVIVVEESDTKKDAKRKAAEQALRMLKDAAQVDDSPTLEGLSVHDRIAALCHLQFTQLLKQTSENINLHKYMSAFVIKRGGQDQGTVVAIGTGNANLSANQRTGDGRSLNDCHSVVIARRALLKYFHREMKAYFGGQTVESIFEPLPGSHLLQLKPAITVHLYMTRAPCGDATIFNTQTDSRMTAEMLEEMDSGKHTPTYPSDDAGFTAAKTGSGFNIAVASDVAPSGGSMSCSDKVLKWNTLGLQGSLYAHYLQPVYLNSITIGSLYNHGHLTRALCCRLTEDIADYLPAGYKVHHTHLGRVTTADPSHAQTVLTQESINWSLGDPSIEIVDPATGKSSPRSPFRTSGMGASRLAKAGFLFRFRDIARACNRKDLFDLPNYHQAKTSSSVYQQASATLKEHLQVTGFGHWLLRIDQNEFFTQ